MEKIYSTFSELTKSVLSLIKIIILSKNVKFPQPRSKPQKIKILGNGPSLNKDLDTLIDGDCDFMTVNFMPNSGLFETIKPKYHMLTAPEFFIPNESEIKLKKNEELFNNLVNKIQWNCIIVVSSRLDNNHKYLKLLHSNPKITIQKLNLTPVEGLISISHKLFDMGAGMPRPHNVLIPSLIMSIRLRYEEIYLLGADHSWLKDLRVDENNQALLNQKHFYDIDRSKEKPMLLLARRERKLHEILHKFYLSFKAYHEIKAYAEAKGTKIYNCTPGSFIDAFERYKRITL